MQELRIVYTDVRHIDLESLKRMAGNPNVEVETHGCGDVYIGYKKQNAEML